MEARRRRISRWVDAFGARALNVARSLTESEDEARDLVQEAWLIVLDHDGPLPESVGDARVWVYQILLKLSASHSRTSTRRSGILTRFRSDFSDSVEPGVLLDERALVREVLRCVDQLPSLQRRVLVARILDGLSVRETARQIDRAPGTVKASLSRAIRTLKEMLGADLEEALRRAPLSRRSPARNPISRKPIPRNPIPANPEEESND